MTFVLIPSPLLGPATWLPVAACLEQEGYDAVVAEVPAVTWRPAEVLAVLVGIVERIRGAVLVPHSNAGLYAPALADKVGVETIVFVDAALPTAAPTPLAPPAFLDHLRGLADADGVLPPWTRWWGDVDHLFPDEGTRHAVEAEQRRLPLGYFTSTLPVPAGWERRRCAYLAFGNTYATELASAIEGGWPTEVLDGEHLHQLVDPSEVATALVRLSRR